MQHDLRVQVSLIATGAGGRKTPIPPEEFRTVLTASGQNFSAALFPAETIHPGGPAVHCHVTLLDREFALPYFPPGTQFGLWEGGRKGYGSVLGWS